jgi:hydroxyacylglutathione hydrolase
MCASGTRATVAAGGLASRGISQLDIYLGSMDAWKKAHDPACLLMP